jgi:hypothetical protein
MEDYNLTRRMERHGGTWCIDTPALITSARKFAGRHPVGIVFEWRKIHTLYGLGVNSKCLAKMAVSMGRRNTLIFDQKMECWNALQTSDLFYERAEVGDMGSLATRRVDEFDRTWV